MTSQSEKTARFLELHRPGNPLLMPNPWDQGSARLLASLGFHALATTSSGFAATLGRLDGSVSRDEALDHAAAIVAATELPVSADLENCFADDPAGVAETIVEAIGRGEFAINGFRNRDLRALLYGAPAATPDEERRRAAKVTRQLRMLRAHGLIRKVPKTHRYVLSDKGQATIPAILAARQADSAKLTGAA